MILYYCSFVVWMGGHLLLQVAVYFDDPPAIISQSSVPLGLEGIPNIKMSKFILLFDQLNIHSSLVSTQMNIIHRMFLWNSMQQKKYHCTAWSIQIIELHINNIRAIKFLIHGNADAVEYLVLQITLILHKFNWLYIMLTSLCFSSFKLFISWPWNQL